MSVRQLISSCLSAFAGGNKAREMREYESFASAFRDSKSYEDARLVNVVCEKTRNYRAALDTAASLSIDSRQLAQNMFVLLYVEPQRPLNILELGGVCGAGYFEAKRYLPHRVHRWSIVETTAMSKAAQSLVDGAVLSFHDDLQSALAVLPSRDLVIAQGVLQYAPDPLQTLKDLFDVSASWVYVTRSGFLDQRDDQNTGPIFTRQDSHLSEHGPGAMPASLADGQTSTPMTLVSLDSVYANIPANYEVVFRFRESVGETLLIGQRHVNVAMAGFVARRRT